MKSKKIISLLLATLMIFSLTSCASSYNIGSNYDGAINDSLAVNGSMKSSSSIGFGGLSKDKYYESQEAEDMSNFETTEAPDINSSNSINPTIYNERKIVYKSSIETETKDIEKAMNDIYKLIDDNKGYIESENRDNWNSFDEVYTRRSANITIKVPSEKFSTFIDSISNDNIIITSMNKSSTDLSNSYYDKEMRLESLRIQETRLLELLKESTTVDIMLQIENSLTDVRYEIETLTRDLRLIDADVEYSTVDFYIYEVQRYGTPISQPKTFWEELGIRFQESFENFADFLKDSLFVLIELLPFITVITVIVIVIIVIAKSRKKKNKKDKIEDNTENKNEENKENSR